MKQLQTLQSRLQKLSSCYGNPNCQCGPSCSCNNPQGNSVCPCGKGCNPGHGCWMNQRFQPLTLDDSVQSIKSSVKDEVIWNVESLVEDLEVTMKVVSDTPTSVEFFIDSEHSGPHKLKIANEDGFCVIYQDGEEKT